MRRFIRLEGVGGRRPSFLYYPGHATVSVVAVSSLVLVLTLLRSF